VNTPKDKIEIGGLVVHTDVVSHPLLGDRGVPGGN
jgi:hypothetical protein